MIMFVLQFMRYYASLNSINSSDKKNLFLPTVYCELETSSLLYFDKRNETYLILCSMTWWEVS